MAIRSSDTHSVGLAARDQTLPGTSQLEAELHHDAEAEQGRRWWRFLDPLPRGWLVVLLSVLAWVVVAAIGLGLYWVFGRG